MVQKIRSQIVWSKITWPLIKTVGAYALFWSWNLIFLAFMILGFAPTILPDLFAAVRAGIVPTEFVIYGLIVTVIPVIAVLLGATVLRRHPRRLLALGYGIEGPLMLILIVRFFGLQALNPAMLALFVIAALGLLTFLWQVLDIYIDERSFLAPLRMSGLTMMLAIGLYASVWIAFYVLPLGIELIQSLFGFLREIPQMAAELWQDLRTIRLADLTLMALSMSFSVVVGSLLMAYTATLLVGMPIVVPVLYWTGWRRAVREMRAHWSAMFTGGVIIATLAVALLAMVITTRQPQHRAFALLEDPPTSMTEAQILLDHREAIREGLLNAYLSPFRYVSAVGEVRHIREMYTWALDMEQTQAASVQQIYELWARPILYTPVTAMGEEVTISETRNGGIEQNVAMREESQKAAELYENFFDEPINQGERERVVDAVRSTWEFNRAEAAWQAVDDREVHLVRQEITVEEQGDWANLELYEAYQNQTTQPQEVVYYFSLPESAVVTGVWLGNSTERDDRFVYRVAPRGAAQAVYRNELRQNRDPALVEQIGPRQYRLRIFPIPARQFRTEDRSDGSMVEEGQLLHMWITWRVLRQDAGWALPNLAERRNIYWDEHSVRLLNGEPFAEALLSADLLQDPSEVWMPAWAAASTESATEPTAHRIDFANGESVLVRPLHSDELSETPKLPAQARLALIIDRSYSMQSQADLLQKELEQLTANYPEAEVDVYLTASPYLGEAPIRLPLSELEPTNLVFFGGQNAAELLVQFNELREDELYDIVLLLTDGTGYELGEGGTAVSVPESPLWMVHLGGDFPLGYDDDTLEAIQSSGGGVTGGILEALTRFVFSLETTPADEAATTRDLIDGYLWETLPTTTISASEEQLVVHAAKDDATDGFAAFGGRRLILAQMQRARHQLDDVAMLDQLHAIAIEKSIVTPYSSMIVLVNERQEKLLDELENQADRFEREHEDVGNTLPPNALEVTGVPEPEEWLLIMLAVGVLGWYITSNRSDRGGSVI